MFKHGFSEETPLEEILEVYLGIDITNKPLDRVLDLVLKEYSSRRKNLQPTYAQFSAESLRVKFRYIIERLLDFYGLHNKEKEERKAAFWKSVEASNKSGKL